MLTSTHDDSVTSTLDIWWQRFPGKQCPSSTRWVKMENQGRGTAPPRDGSVMGARSKSTELSGHPTPVVEDRTDRLEKMVRTMVESQRHQQDQIEAETLRQERRWKGMEHQFKQLQQLVRGDPASMQATRQSLAGLQQMDPPSSRPSTAFDPLNMPFLDVPTPQPHPDQHQGCRAPSTPPPSALPLLWTSSGGGNPLRCPPMKRTKILNTI